MTDTFDLNYQEKTLEQFECNPYPSNPIAASPKKDVALLYKNSLVTGYYHRYHRVLADLSECVILDLACGTGFTTLTLAEANPGAKIIATDISQKSLKIAEERLTHHGFHNIEYHLLALEEIDQLDLRFDYINASDILYLLPDISLALKQLASVLKPKGIIRGNLHSYYCRLHLYRSQELFSRMGLMDINPEEIEMGIVRDFFKALKDTTDLKLRTRGKHNPEESGDQVILMNYLFQNDKGFTMPQLLDFLERAGLDLIDMVDWREWQLTDLFKEPENLPAFLAMGFADLELGEQLCLYELIQPDKRLLDFWCGHPDPEPDNFIHTIEQEDKDWRNIQVYLHPQLKTDEFKQEACSTERAFPLNLKNHVPFLLPDVWLDRILVNGLFAPLFEQSRSLGFLVDRWLKIQPVNPVTLSPTSESEAFVAVSEAVIDQQRLGVFLLDIANDKS
jgi:ubiquinone/menaquinone biosynthesis C-methylase UbiE